MNLTNIGDGSWDSVRNSVRNSFRDSVWYAIDDFIWFSIQYPVWYSVRISGRGSIMRQYESN
jgi:hypothetical protein